jgi:hypothetical protein
VSRSAHLQDYSDAEAVEGMRRKKSDSKYLHEEIEAI